jgi:hypothetical protein
MGVRRSSHGTREAMSETHTNTHTTYCKHPVLFFSHAHAHVGQGTIVSL